MKDLEQASARGVAWNLVQNLVGRLLGLVVVAILARFLDRSMFGAVALAGAVTAFAELLISQGFGEFITQRADLTDEQTDTAFWFNAALGVVLTGIVLVAAEPLAMALGEETAVTPIVRLLSLSILFRALSVVPTGLLVRSMKFRALSLRSLVAGIIGGIAGIISAFAGLGIYSLVVQALVGDAIALLALWRATPWRPRLRFSSHSLLALLSFGAPIFGATMLNFVSRRLDTVIVVGALGLATLGVYSMGQRMFQIANQILNKSSDSVALSALAKLTDEDQRRQAFYKVIELNAVLCFPLYAGLALVAEPLVVTVFSARWIDSAPVLTMFGLAGLPISLSYLHAAALKSVGQTRGYLVVHIALVLVYLPVLLLLVDGGATSASLAYVIGVLAIMPVEIWLVRLALRISIPTYLRSLIGPIIATAAMAGAMLALARFTFDLHPAARLGVEILIGGGAYVIALRILAPGTFRRCRDLVRATLRRS